MRHWIQHLQAFVCLAHKILSLITLFLLYITAYFFLSLLLLLLQWIHSFFSNFSSRNPYLYLNNIKLLLFKDRFLFHMGLIFVFVVFVQWLIVSGSSSRSSWGTWGCIAHLQFGSASNWTAVLQMHDLRSTFVRHCVILTFALCFSWKPFEFHKNQLSHKSKWVDLVLKFCWNKLAEQYSQEQW